MNCLHSFRTLNKRESLKKVCENKDFYGVVMPSQVTKILEFNLYRESANTPFITDADLESLIKRIDGCKINSKKSSTTKLDEYIPLWVLLYLNKWLWFFTID